MLAGGWDADSGAVRARATPDVPEGIDCFAGIPNKRVALTERRLEEPRQDRLQRTKAEIAARLRRVCEELSPDDFDALVERMASIEIKYTMRRSDDLFPDRGRPPAPPSVDEE